MSYTIYNDNVFSVLPTLPKKSVQCIVTSPPYWSLRDYHHEHQIGLENSVTDYIEKLVEVFRLCRDILKDDGTLWLNIGDTYVGGKGKSGSPDAGKQKDRVEKKQSFSKPHQSIGGYNKVRPADNMSLLKQLFLKPKDLIGIPWRVAFALQADGWFLRNDIIWNKPNAMPESVTDRCTKSHEYIFLFAKSKSYYFDHESIKEKCSLRGYKVSWTKRKEKGEDIRQIYKGARGVRFGVQNNLMRNKRSVWNVSTNAFRSEHIAAFPPELIKPCILAGCPPGGIVLDPFAGTGTTGAVCERIGRDSILIELVDSYCSLIPQRINDINSSTKKVVKSHSPEQITLF